MSFSCKGRRTTLHLKTGDITINARQRSEMMNILFEWQEGIVNPRQLGVGTDGSYIMTLRNIPPIVTEKSDFVALYNTMFAEQAKRGLDIMEDEHSAYGQKINLNYAYHVSDDDSCMSDFEHA